MFALAEEGYTSVFQQLIACILSIRTRDEVSLVAARRLFPAAPAPEDRAACGLEEIDRLIADVSFHQPKAAQIRDIARITVSRFGGKLPCDAETLREFRGVGPKCAHLALGIACGEARISVDVHVHRVNRWGSNVATTECHVINGVLAPRFDRPSLGYCRV